MPETHEKGRYSTLDIFNVWAVSSISIPAISIGFLIGANMGLWNGIAAVFAGLSINGAIAGLSGYLGAKHQKTTVELLNQCFGVIGAKLPGLLIGIAILGWFAFQLEFFIETFFGLYPDFLIPKSPLIIATGMIMSSSSIIGFQGLSILSRIAIPALIFVLCYAIYNAIPADAAIATFNFSFDDFVIGVGMAIGGTVLGTVVAPDITCYGKSPIGSAIATSLGLTLVGGILLSMGVILSHYAGINEFQGIYPIIGFSNIAAFAIFIASWTTNDTNLFVSSQAFDTVLGGSISRRTASIFGGAVGILLAMTGVIDQLVPFLTVLSIIFAPVGGVYVLFILFSDISKKSNRFKAIPLICWVGGIITALLTAPSSQFGFDQMTFTSIPALDGMIAAAIFSAIFLIGHRIFHRMFNYRD